MLLELLRHTDAVVLDAEHIGGAAAARARLFHDADVDGAARRGEFYGIADDVQQNLVQAQLVGDDILVLDILRIYIQIQLLGADIALYDGAQVVQHIGRCTGALSSLMVPLSMRLISKTSLIRLSRCCPDTLIFCR